MVEIFPSQVVDYIDKHFPWAREHPRKEMLFGLKQTNDCGLLRGLTELVERIPNHLIGSSANTNDVFAAVACIRSRVLQSESRSVQDRAQAPDLLGGIDFRNELYSPVAVILNVLMGCPDQAATPFTSDLTFILDDGLREQLRTDISSCNRALETSQWKAATVLSGSVIEALLLWAIQQRPAADVERESGKNLDPTEWRDAGLYIITAEKLGIIKPDTAIQCKLAKNFRNLIHPGRQQRLGATCDRGTALSAVAGLELVVRDLG